MVAAIIPELIPADYFAPLPLAEIFSRSAPLEVDLGCGDGTFLVALAARFPQRNFLGIERLLGRVRTACKKAARAELANVRVLRVELIYAIQYLIPPASVEVAHLLFPDPWPKSRHRRRRIVTPEFLAAVHRFLAPGGLLRIATDRESYFQTIEEIVPPELFRPEKIEADFPRTRFEEHFIAAGKAIHRLELRKVS